MFTFIAIGFAVLVLLLVVVVSLQPAHFRVTRTAVIAAEPGAVFANVNDFHKWEAWSPWAKLDPNSTAAYAGASSGEGAIFSWVGNAKVGEGRMTILESRPSDFIKINLEFFKPFKATNTAEFTFKPAGMQTEVTWSMHGKNNFMGKAMGLIMNCDKMIGGSFEKGLSSLNDASRATASAQPAKPA